MFAFVRGLNMNIQTLARDVGIITEVQGKEEELNEINVVCNAPRQ